MSKQRVYFAQATWGGPIKIGCSYNVDQRLKTLQGPLPFDLVEIGSFSGNDFHEKYLHAWFHEGRIRGEWFNPTPDLWRCAMQARVHGSVDFVPNESIMRPGRNFNDFVRLLELWRISTATFAKYLELDELYVSQMLLKPQVAPMRWLAALCAALKREKGRDYDLSWHQPSVPKKFEPKVESEAA